MEIAANTASWLSTKELAEASERPLSTVKRWVDLGIPHEVVGGARRFPPEAVDIVQRIGALFDGDRSACSVRFVLADVLRPMGQPVSPAHGPVDQPTSRVHGPGGRHAASAHEAMSQPTSQGSQLDGLIEQLGQEVVGQVVTALRGETELAEKYARAAHTIGQLEERVRVLEVERVRLIEAVEADKGDRQAEFELALAAVQEAAARETSLRLRLAEQQAAVDRDRLAGELAEAKAERDQARALLAVPPRPWWKVWG